MTEHLGYEPHASGGRNTGNSRNGKGEKTVHTENGSVEIEVPRDRAGLGVKLTLVVTGAGAGSIGAPLVALGLAQAVGLGLQQTIQRFLDRFPHHFAQMALDLRLIDLNDFT